MNFVPRLDEAAEEQASLWAARIDGSALSGTHRAALEVWLAESPAHRVLLSRYCQVSADLEQQLPALAAAGVFAGSSGAIRRRRIWTRLLTAGLAAAAVAVLVFWFERPPTQSETAATPPAHRETLTLSDGTRIELNARTSLRIDIGKGDRRARLATGEAYFAVAHDPARPFLVETPAGWVRVTGTKFDVRADSPNSLQVTVVEGTVQVSPKHVAGRAGTPLLLNAGEQLSAGPGGVRIRHLSTEALDGALAWRHGQIVFFDVPLREALARFARYHDRKITVTPDAGKLRLGGRYSLDNLNAFLRAIEMAEPVRVTREPNGTLRVSLRP